METQAITRAELVHFAQQMALLSFFAGVVGAMAWGVVMHALNGAADWFVQHGERKARIKAARARAVLDVRGMGHRPMVDLSHPTYPDRGAGGELGCVSKFGEVLTQAHGDGGRAVGRSDDPRPLNLDQARPISCLKDKRAAGAPAVRCGHGGSDDSVETPSVLEELALAPLGPHPPSHPAFKRAHGVDGDSVETPGVLEELAATPPRPLRPVQVA